MIKRVIWAGLVVVLSVLFAMSAYMRFDAERQVARQQLSRIAELAQAPVLQDKDVLHSFHSDARDNTVTHFVLFSTTVIEFGALQKNLSIDAGGADQYAARLLESDKALLEKAVGKSIGSLRNIQTHYELRNMRQQLKINQYETENGFYYYIELLEK